MEKKKVRFSSLLYGFSQPSSIYYYYRHYSFYYRADENGVKLPKIHLILCKASSINKEPKLGIGGASSPKAEEIEKYWHFVYDIYTKHRNAFELHSNERTSSSSSSSSVDYHSTSLFNNHINNSLQADTFEEFMRQYVMHIGHETNTVSRIAIKSHSPLLAVKHLHQSTAQTFDKTLNDIVERI